jgi:hypothetical protein
LALLGRLPLGRVDAFVMQASEKPAQDQTMAKAPSMLDRGKPDLATARLLLRPLHSRSRRLLSPSMSLEPGWSKSLIRRTYYPFFRVKLMLVENAGMEQLSIRSTTIEGIGDSVRYRDE